MPEEICGARRLKVNNKLSRKLYTSANTVNKCQLLIKEE
jgi:hypothetical protein